MDWKVSLGAELPWIWEAAMRVYLFEPETVTIISLISDEQGEIGVGRLGNWI